MENIKNIKKDICEFLDGFKKMIRNLKDKNDRIKQIPNLITLSRVIFAFLIPPVALTGNLGIAATLTIVAAATDGIDGFAARKLNAVSEFGKNLDPVCDKIFAGALLIPLMTKLSPLLAIGLGANLVLEVGIASINLNSKAKGNTPKTTMLGKIKTAMLSLSLASLYASFSYQPINAFIPIIYVLTTTTQILALNDYYQIDKKKDLKKEKLNLFNGDTQINDILETSKKPQIEQEAKKEPLTYSPEDYKLLREEVIRMHSKPDEEIGFQKTK